MKKLDLRHNLPLALSLLAVTVSLPLALFVSLTQQTSYQTSAKANKFSWEFNQKGNLEGWTGAGFAKKVTVTNGYLKATTVDTKGKEIMIKSALFSPLLENFSGLSYPQLKLRMRVTNSTEEINGKMILEWYYQSDSKNKAKLSSQLFVDTIEDGKYHTYTIDLSDKPTWTKYFIKQIKLTPTVSNPRTIYLDWVRFNKQNVTITPQPTPVAQVRLTEIGKVIKYQPKRAVLGITTENLNDTPVMEYDEPEVEKRQVLGIASPACVKDQQDRPVCVNPEIYPLCPNGKPIDIIDPCGCPKLVCPPTVTPTPPQPEEKFALETEDGRVYFLETNSPVIPPCKGTDCPLLGMPSFFLDFSEYVGKTVLVEGILSGNFPNDVICTLSYPPTCFPGYPYPREGTLSVNAIHLAQKYATNQILQGYLYPSTFNYLNENVYLFYREQQGYLSPQPYPCEGNDCPVPSKPSVIIMPGESEGGVAPSYGGNAGPGVTRIVPPYPGNLTYARSSTVDLGVFVNNQVKLTSDGYYVGEQKDRFLNVKKVEPVIVTPTPYPTSIICNNPLKNIEVFNECAINSYQYAKYSCNNGSTAVMGSPNDCRTRIEWENEASLACQNQCPYPTPTIINRCSSQGSCRNGEVCPVGTSCSGLPAYGCFPDGCPVPICLAKDTRISTPSGTSAVQDLREGSLVISVDENGEKITVPVIKVSKTKVENHQVAYLVLTDGRTLWVSPKHPTVDSRTVSDLKSGDFYDGARVLRTELVPYQDEYTYDLLPDGPTGFYFANDILLNSTLR